MKEFPAHIPEYKGGWKSKKIYKTGCGLNDDYKKDSDSADSFMKLIKHTTKAEFTAYLGVLEGAYGKPVFTNENEAGMYAEFLIPEGSLYTYHTYSKRYTTIIADGTGSTVKDFSDGYSGNDKDVLLMQYGLYYSKMISGYTSDCGMCYVMRLADNSLIMLDGGEFEQCTVPAVEDLMAKLHYLTGTQKGEKVRVAAWMCTHEHNDHMDMFCKLLREYPGEFCVERVVFNFPSYSAIEHTECVPRLRDRIKTCLPDVKFLNVHTGHKFSLGGVTFDILVSHEDIIYKKAKRPYDGMNGTTTVFKATAKDGAVIFLGDLQRNGARVLAESYAPGTLECDYVQAAHHCINDVPEAYEKIKAKKVLIPQSENDCRTRNKHNLDVILKFNKDENCIFAGNGTDILTFGENAGVKEHFPVAAPIPYDGSEI